MSDQLAQSARKLAPPFVSFSGATSVTGRWRVYVITVVGWILLPASGDSSLSTHKVLNVAKPDAMTRVQTVMWTFFKHHLQVSAFGETCSGPFSLLAASASSVETCRFDVEEDNGD